jgi:hypothetical protein
MLVGFCRRGGRDVATQLEPTHPPLPVREIAAAAQALINLLDAIDGDFDLEMNGDEEDANAAEDDFVDHAVDGLAGCPVADPPEEDSEDCDGFENEPLFDRAGCTRLNLLFGEGPGGGAVLDSDYGAEEAGEPEGGI